MSIKDWGRKAWGSAFLLVIGVVLIFVLLFRGELTLDKLIAVLAFQELVFGTFVAGNSSEHRTYAKAMTKDEDHGQGLVG